MSRIRNMRNSRVLHMPGFWIYQSSEYTFSSEYTRVLNMPGLHHGDIPWLHRVWNMPEWIHLNNSWICLNMPEYAWIYLNLPELLCVAFPHRTSLSIWTRGYLLQSLHETRRYSLKEHKAIFWRAMVDFFYRSWKYLLCFLL